MPASPELHENCISLAPLLGTWKGSGEGHYTTIDDFEYFEELTFDHVGKPFLSMHQRTRDASTGAPLHTEFGYLRATDAGTFELLVVQPSGLLEVDSVVISATADGLELDTASAEVSSTPTAKIVIDLRRRIVVRGDEMVSDMWMEAVGEPMQHHLRATLTRS